MRVELTAAMGRMLLRINNGEYWYTRHEGSAQSRTMEALKARGMFNDRWGFTDAPDHGLSALGLEHVAHLKEHGLPEKLHLTNRMKRAIRYLHEGVPIRNSWALRHTSTREGLRRRGLLTKDNELSPAGLLIAKKIEQQELEFRARLEESKNPRRQGPADEQD